MKVIRVRSPEDLEKLKKIYLKRDPSLIVVDRVNPIGFDGYKGGKLRVRVIVPDSQ